MGQDRMKTTSRFCRHYHLSQYSTERKAIMALYQPVLKPSIKPGACLAMLKTEWVTSKPDKCINVKRWWMWYTAKSISWESGNMIFPSVQQPSLLASVFRVLILVKHGHSI